jgi:hypothetical protein
MTERDTNKDTENTDRPQRRTVPGIDPSLVGEPVETEDGTRRPAQQNVGSGVEEGGGEWPDPATPPRPPAPGSAAPPEHR